MRTKIRAAYQNLRFIQEVAEQHPDRDFSDMIKERKEDIRKSLKTYQSITKAQEECDEFRFEKEDGCTAIQYYKVEADSREEVENHVQDEIRTVDSVYDCSGQWFTSSIRFAHMKNNEYLIYHRMSMDI